MLRRARTAAGTPQIVNKGDSVGEVLFEAFDGDKFTAVASISSTVNGAPNEGKIATNIAFKTSANEGPQAGKAVEWMTLGSDGTLLPQTQSEKAFTVNGGARIGKDVTVDGALNAKGVQDGDASVTKQISTGNGIAVQNGNINVQKGGIVISGSAGLAVDGGDISAKGKLSTTGDISSGGGMHAMGSVAIDGSLRVASDKTEAVAIPSGGLAIGKNLKVASGGIDVKDGGARIVGETIIDGNVKCKEVAVEGKLAVSDASDESAIFAGGVTIAKALSAKESLAVGEGGASIVGDVDVGGKLNCAGDAVLQRGLAVAGKSDLKGAVTVTGNVHLSGKLLVTSSSEDGAASMDVWEAVNALRGLVEEKATAEAELLKKLQESEQKWNTIVEKLENRIKILEGKLGSAA